MRGDKVKMAVRYPENVSKAMDAGASGFVAKPFNKESLSNYIRGSAVHHRKSM